MYTSSFVSRIVFMMLTVLPFSSKGQKDVPVTAMDFHLERSDYEQADSIKKQLEGKWRWSHNPDGWGNPVTPASCQCTKAVHFSKDSVWFYRGDTVIRQSAFNVQPYKLSAYSRTYFYLVLFDRPEMWQLSLYTDKEKDGPSIGYINTPAIRINKDIYCGGDCPEEVYQKEAFLPDNK